MASSRGKLIVIEGLDRAGKSTQVERLVANLAAAGVQVEKVRFPDRSTPIGKSIDAYLKGETNINDQVIHLLFSANRWEAENGLRTKLLSGTTLVVDRYSFSGAVYSAAKGNPTLDLDWAWNMEIGLLRPDVVCFLDISPEVQAARGGFGQERYENDRMQMAVREMFDRLWTRYDGRLQRISAEGTLDEVENRVLTSVKSALDAVGKDAPLEVFRALND